MKALKFKEAYCNSCNAICKVEWSANNDSCSDLCCKECHYVIATVYGVRKDKQKQAPTQAAAPVATIFRDNDVHSEFERMARSMMKWLCENQHPHTIIITPTSAELLEGSVAFTDASYVKD